MKLFDSHAHMGDDALYNRENLYENCVESGVDRIISICTDEKSLKKSIDLQEKFLLKEKPVKIDLACATGPNEVALEAKGFWSSVTHFAKSGRLVAIGETGLDCYWDKTCLSEQKAYFIECIHLALEVNLPLIIHCRQAFKETLDLLDHHYYSCNPKKGVLFHCFTGGIDEMRALSKRGIYASFSGLITYRSAKEIQEAAKEIDSHLFMVETDSPYLTPGPKRNRVNQPSHVKEVAQFMAELRGVDLETLSDESYRNTMKFFGLKN